MNSFYFLLFFVVLFHNIHADDDDIVKVSGPKLKKDPRDFTDNDVNDLFEQWEVIGEFYFDDSFMFVCNIGK